MFNSIKRSKNCNFVNEGRGHEGLPRGVDHRRRDLSPLSLGRNSDRQIRDQKNGLRRRPHRDNRNALVLIFCRQGESALFSTLFNYLHK